MSRINDPFAGGAHGINPFHAPVPTKAAKVLGMTQTGQTVQVAQTAQQPAHPSRLGGALKSFVATMNTVFQTVKAAVENAVVFKPLSRQVFNATVTQPINPGSMSKADRDGGSFAFIKNSADGTSPSNIGSFMRGNTSGSKLTSFAAQQPETTAVMQRIRDLIGDQPIAVDKKSYGLSYDGQSTQTDLATFASLKNNDAQAIAAVAQRSVDTIDRMMCDFLGTPGNQQSIDDAAQRLPQSLCDQLAIAFRAVDVSAAPANLKDGMKLHLARDALVLRAVNPSIADIVGTMVDDKNNRTEAGSSLLQVSKAIQSLINGSGMGIKDTQPEVVQAGQHMQARWDNGLLNFIDAVVARADPATVAAAEQRGGRILEARV